MVEYDILKDVFVDHGQVVLNSAVFGYSQYYIQYNQTMMYMLPIPPYYSGSPLIMFNLESLESQEIDTCPDCPVGVSYTACIVSSERNESLYIIGGHDGSYKLASVQTFQLDSQTWITNVADMNTARMFHSCLVEEVSQRFYAVGGTGEMSIEHIESIYIDSDSWVTLNDELPVGLRNTRLVAINRIIYVIGGWDVSANHYDAVYTIDAATGEVSTHSDALPRSDLTGMATIVVDDVIYGFGGRCYNNSCDWWVTYGQPTMAPTNPTWAPTTNPTKYPTSGPTSLPTNDPSTASPTGTPTGSPTTAEPSQPTQEPSDDPTRSPSTDPTTIPSTGPTAEPTTGPTMEPTMGPSTEPTAGPTVEPTGPSTDVETTEMIEFGHNVVSLHWNHSHNI